MIYSNKKALYFATDKRNNVYFDLVSNPQIEETLYNRNIRQWESKN